SGRLQPGVEHRDDAPVARRPDEPAGALGEADRGDRHAHRREAGPAPGVDRRRTRCGQRLVGARERQPGHRTEPPPPPPPPPPATATARREGSSRGPPGNDGPAAAAPLPPERGWSGWSGRAAPRPPARPHGGWRRARESARRARRPVAPSPPPPARTGRKRSA